MAAGRAGMGGYSVMPLPLLVLAWAGFAALAAWLLGWPWWAAAPAGLAACVLFFLSFQLWGELAGLSGLFKVSPGGASSRSGPPAHLKNSSGTSSTDMKVDHIGIATARLDDSLRFWRDALGLEVKHTEVVEDQGVRVAMLPAGEPRIELLEPTGPETPVARFLEKRGPGIHHVAVRVPDIRAALARLKAEGARLIDAEPRTGAGGCLVAFVHPQTAGGVLLELVEHAPAGQESESER